jgi:RHS repeat-associated protein
MTAVNYLWNPLNDNIVREFDDAGAVGAEYTTEPEEFGNVISQRRDSEDDYFHYDGVGSTLAVSNQAGTVTDTRAYTATGDITEQSGTTAFPFQYVGQKGYYLDEVTRTYLARRRALDEGTGRWFSIDPMATSTPQSPYVYVENTAPNAIDPSGLVGAIPIPCRVVGRCPGWFPVIGPCDYYIIELPRPWIDEPVVEPKPEPRRPDPRQRKQRRRPEDDDPCFADYISCLHTTLADQGHRNRCYDCWLACRGLGGTWRGTMNGLDCAYWNYPSTE